MSKHTPGPWRLAKYLNSNGDNVGRVVADDSTGNGALPIADVDWHWSGGKPDIQTANAHLIAAAPELLEACLLMRARITALANEGDCCWRDWEGAYAVDAAIAKATRE